MKDLGVNDLELMALHCDALYVHSDDQDLVCVNDWLRRPAPTLWLGMTAHGMLVRFRQDVPADTRRRVELLIAQEPREPLPDRRPRHHDDYCSLVGSLDAVAGPTYWLPSPTALPDQPEHRVAAADAALLRDSALADWIPDIPHQQPMFVSTRQGRAVAVCASVRMTPRAHEAGVETAPNHRRRGHAGAVVGAWARALLASSIVPLYSTTWENLASRHLAESLGFRPFGWEYRVG